MDLQANEVPIRTAIRFETSDARYQWLTRTLGVGDGRFDGKRVTYEISTLE